jgi:nucleotide-binding universal stress UspA family protein
MSQPVAQIVVGIDGSTSAANALEWAVGEAERRGLRLVIAHAGDVPRREALSEASARAVLDDVGSYGRELLADAVATVVEDHVLDVRTELRYGDPAAMLIELSEDAQLLVVGRGNGGPLARFVLGSTSQRVAGHARCPVVVVDTVPSASNRIVVGVSRSDGGRQAMDFACREAVARGAKLRAGEAELLEEALAAARKQFPTLAIDGQSTGVPAHVALTEAAGAAALIVVGCRRGDGSVLPVLGPLASWMLHHAPCPVAIVSAVGDG